MGETTILVCASAESTLTLRLASGVRTSTARTPWCRSVRSARSASSTKP